jgi:hypothetical protein
MICNVISSQTMELHEKLKKLFDAFPSYRHAEARLKEAGLDVSYNTIRRWCEPGGDPKVSQLQFVARFFEVSVVALVDPAADGPSPPTWARRKLEEWIARNGEDWVIDRVALIDQPAAMVPAPESTALVRRPSHRTLGDSRPPAPPTNPASTPAVPGKKARR